MGAELERGTREGGLPYTPRVLFMFSLNVRFAEPQSIVNPTKELRRPMVGYVKTILVDAATVDRARELAVATVDDGTVVGARYRECDVARLDPAVAKALAAVEPGPERVVVMPSLIYYGDGSKRSWLRRLLSRARSWLNRGRPRHDRHEVP